MREINLTISIPRFKEEQSIISENTRLLNEFLELCENSPTRIVESDLQSFFDAYAQLETIHKELASSSWAHGRDMNKIVEDVLVTSKSAFDDLGISVQCVFDNDRIEKLSGFEKIRDVF